MVVSREESQARLDRMAAGAMFYDADAEYGIADFFEEQVSRRGDAVFLFEGEGQLSWNQLNHQANRFAGLLSGNGLKVGDTVALMIENRAAYFSAWLGMMKLGLITAMINNQARGEQLAHMLKITDSRALIIGEECLESLDAGFVRSLEPPIFSIADGQTSGRQIAGVQAVEPLLESQSVENPDKCLRKGLVGSAPAMYCFTSGTTGMPKAALISHARWLGVGKSWQLLQGTDENDVFYCVLPLFHGAAGMSLISNMMTAMGKLVLRRRFSASKFWHEVRRHGVTTFQYIGEICRYLVSTPPVADERNHTLVRMMGAGMTADVWQRFLERFGDIEVYEGLGATESNCSLVNPDGAIGSCGRIPFQDRSNARLVRYDMENDCYIRTAEGWLIEAAAGEVGELVGMILDLPGTVSGRFEGYTDAQATEKKILRNVFQQGDAWFATGDLLRRDEEDYYYFVDRIGDTFRWKSENVSTTEVALALAEYSKAEMINIYGVKVPENEGRAGMAAVEMKTGETFDGEEFYRIANSNLPAYAVPLFVRLTVSSDLTATFKLRKVELRREGYSPTLCSDPVYVLSPRHNTYLPYSEQALQDLGVKPFSVE